MHNVNVVIRLQVEGFHNWENAPEAVAFLKDRHRHIFHLECVKEVNHSDRDVEIILFKRAVQDHFKNNYMVGNAICAPNWCEFGGMSCEMIAEEILEAFDCRSVQCLEDNENGSIVFKD